MQQPIKTAGVLIFSQKLDKVLLVRHGSDASHQTGVYGIPAGRLEQNETPSQAAVRELHEETGLETQENQLQMLPTEYTAEIKRKDGTKFFSLTVYVCHKYTGDLTESEESKPEWIGVKDLARLNLLPNIDSAVYEGLKVLS